MKFGRFAKGVAILAKYEDPEAFSVSATHDQLFCCSYELPLTPEDRAEMERLGWFKAEESWAAFT